MANNLIARDEGEHVKFACLLYSMLKSKLSEERVHAIVADALVVETQFICDALPCALIGMNSDTMAQYLRYCGNRLLLMLGYRELYLDPVDKKPVANPFEWMEVISMENKANFFEHRVTEYQKANINKTSNSSSSAFTFTTEEDF